MYIFLIFFSSPIIIFCLGLLIFYIYMRCFLPKLFRREDYARDYHEQNDVMKEVDDVINDIRNI